MNIKEACEALGISRMTFYKWEDMGKIKVSRKGRALSVSERTVKARLQQMEHEKYWQERTAEKGDK